MNIYEAIHGVMTEIGVVGKTSKNQQQGFMYRGVDAVMNALQPALVKYGVFVVPEVLNQVREDRTTVKGEGDSKRESHLMFSICTIKYTFCSTDGTSLSTVVIGEGMDSGDKATNKAMAIAFKYACSQVFCIPTEEMKDPDAETQPPSMPAVKDKVDLSKEPIRSVADVTCEDCKKVIVPYTTDKGKKVGVERLIKASREKFGAVLCVSCAEKRNAN